MFWNLMKDKKKFNQRCHLISEENKFEVFNEDPIFNGEHRIECSVSTCFFKITIAIFVYIQKFVCIIQEDWNIPNLESHCILNFDFQCQILLRLYNSTYIPLFCIDLSTKLYQGLWFNLTHPSPIISKYACKNLYQFFLIFRSYNLFKR